MFINVFERVQFVHELKENSDIAGDRLYIFLKENKKDNKVYYEYLGSMLSTLEDESSSFFQAFLPIATHYVVPPDESLSAAALKLKEQLDENDRSLVFEGQEDIAI